MRLCAPSAMDVLGVQQRTDVAQSARTIRQGDPVHDDGHFLVKDMPLETILDGIRVVAAGDALIAPSVTRRLIEEFAARPEPAAARQVLVDGITSREREVLTLVGRGLSNTEIAQELFISVATAKAHLARLFTKLDARDRVHLVILAYETGLVSPSR